MTFSNLKRNSRRLVWIVFFCLLVFSPIYFLTTRGVVAQEPQDRLTELNQKIDEYEAEIQKLTSQANTLSNQIAQYDAQINLTTLKISQTEEKISLFGGRIELLEDSLSSLSDAFASRASQTYKLARLNNDPYMLFLSEDRLSDAVSSFHYLEKIQESDRSLLLRLEDAQATYEQEKEEQEDLQEELEDQKNELDAQKSAKAKLLEVTRNDEKRYQVLLASAQAEREAIQAIIAGKGEETEVGEVGEGERIATVIPGASACSTGGHLHLEVVKDGSHRNPADHLVPKGVTWDNAPDGPFSFGGSWQWPINDPVRITQGYGMTYYASALRYYGGAPHTGIDMVNSDDFTVKAVRSGTLYRGSIACGGGTLRYVRVEQDEDYDTYYLHVNY